MNEVKKNFIYNIVYQILIFILPLITVPYISRIIGPNGIGQYSYTYSIVYYFMIFAMLGLNNYGNRTIAKIRDDNKKMSKIFKEIYILQLLTSSIMILLYILYVFLFDVKYRSLSLIQGIYLISCAFDINWFFFGIEKFKLTVTRNTIIKLLSLVFIFIFVKDINDILVYTMILSLSTLLNQLLLWPFVHKYISNEKIKINDVYKHFLPCLKLFLPVIAVAIYKVMDKTMIGMLSNITEVGYYENAEKIINVPNAIIAALGTVMLPRMSNMYSNGNDKSALKIIEKSISIMMCLAFAMTFGLLTISNDFSIIFFGNEFEKTGVLIQLLSITILFLSWGNVLRTQFLIPKEMDKEYIVSAFLGAGINFIMNCIFIPKYSSIGACYGTIFAEFAVMFYQTYKVRKFLPIKKYILNTLQFAFKSIVMFVIILSIGQININIYIKLLIQIVSAVLIYFLLNYKYIWSFININKEKIKYEKNRLS